MRSNKTLRYFAVHIKKLPHLTLREKEVLTRRLKKNTLESIGKKIGLTEGRIRQIERKALMKVRSKHQQLALFKSTANGN